MSRFLNSSFPDVHGFGSLSESFEVHFECELSPFRIQTLTWSHPCQIYMDLMPTCHDLMFVTDSLLGSGPIQVIPHHPTTMTRKHQCKTMKVFFTILFLQWSWYCLSVVQSKTCANISLLFYICLIIIYFSLRLI